MKHRFDPVIIFGAVIGFVALNFPAIAAPDCPEVNFARLAMLVFAVYFYWSLMVGEVEDAGVRHMKLNARAIALIVGFGSWLAIYLAHIYLLYLDNMNMK